MDNSKDENIRAKERACQVGCPLRLLSIHSTISTPTRRTLSNSTSQDQSFDSTKKPTVRSSQRLRDAKANLELSSNKGNLGVSNSKSRPENSEIINNSFDDLTIESNPPPPLFLFLFY